MTRTPFKPPSFQETSFNCPFCQAYAEQRWHAVRSPTIVGTIEETELCTCAHCGERSIWHNQKMIYPVSADVAPPNEDLDEEIIEDYNEAASILQNSPRGAAALLRLALQKLCIQLGEKGKNINTDIAKLVEKGLSPTIQQSLDAVRVIGNESVHPGQIDLRDDPETAKALFKLLNKITETMITEPKEIEEIYEKIPDSKKQAIEERDKNA